MIKYRNRRSLVLAIIFIVFNILVFVIPFRKNGAFWVAYGFSVLTIIAQLIADTIAFRKADNLKRAFLGVPIVIIAFRCLLAELAICATIMLISLVVNLPAWVAVIPCILVLAYATIAIIFADWSREIIEQIDTKSVTESRFINHLYVDLKSLVPRISDGVLKNKVEKLSEDVRYSDPISIADLADLETAMEKLFASLKQAVTSNGENIGKIADELSLLLTERNNKCRLLRRPQ
ncbi:MAG: hypothetical protein FWG02_10040 [Holophagaceae bacterium]|nr:hypothetical protein [Holophagaceae bacterium]